MMEYNAINSVTTECCFKMGVADGVKGLRPIQEENAQGSGVALKDFSESAEKKKGGGNGFPRAEAELMRVEGVINGI